MNSDLSFFVFLGGYFAVGLVVYFALVAFAPWDDEGDGNAVLSAFWGLVFLFGPFALLVWGAHRLAKAVRDRRRDRREAPEEDIGPRR